MLPGPGGLAASAGEGHEAYARNLLATKDEATVVEVLVRQTGASPEDVSSFLQRLKRAA